MVGPGSLFPRRSTAWRRRAGSKGNRANSKTAAAPRSIHSHGRAARNWLELKLTRLFTAMNQVLTEEG